MTVPLSVLGKTGRGYFYEDIFSSDQFLEEHKIQTITGEFQKQFIFRYSYIKLHLKCVNVEAIN